MRWFVDNFEKKAREIYRYTPFTAIDETLRNFYSSLGPISTGQPHSPDVNHCVLTISSIRSLRVL